MKKLRLIALFVGSFAVAFSQSAEDGFVSLFDGQSFDGWKLTEENPNSFVIEDGAFVTRGPRAHLFYVGEDMPYRNFEFKVDVFAENGSNGGIYFHTKYQASGWPRGGFECQVNVSHGDWKKTGSLYDVANLGFTPVQDKQWWTQRIIVNQGVVTVKLNGTTVLQYREPPGTVAGDTFERKLSEGTFAFQCHDPKSVVKYKNIRVKRLPD